MNRTYVLGGILAAAVLAAGGLGIGAALSSPAGAATATSASPTAASASPASGASIGTAALAPGTALVDGNGRALYLFEADRGTVSACTGSCAQIWSPVLTTGAAPVAYGAVQAQLLGSSVRADGSHQVTYDGHPLYTFMGDKKPDDARGQGINRFGGVWYVVAPDGAALTTSAAAPAPAPSGSTGANGY
jgi:predicted lipoprotein with Yx(FWY)xxD motif